MTENIPYPSLPSPPKEKDILNPPDLANFHRSILDLLLRITRDLEDIKNRLTAGGL